MGLHCVIIMNGLGPHPQDESTVTRPQKVYIACFCSVLMCGNEWLNTEFSIRSSQCGILTEWNFVWSGRRAPNIDQSLTCADSKLSLNSPLSRKGALASSSLLTCVMIEEDGWSMRSVKPVKSQLKKGFRIKIFRLATIELKKRKKKLPANAPKNPKDFYRLRTFIMRHHTRLNVISMLF